MPPPLNLELDFITPEHPLYAAELELRFQVLRAPLGQRREDVLFPFEAGSFHLVARDGSQLVGCVLFHPESPLEGRLLQMAVLPERQGSGLGAALVGKLEDEVSSRGYGRVTLHARATVTGFYERLGYACFGKPFMEVGISHRRMHKHLRPSV